jgi:hypothetical protein
MRQKRPMRITVAADWTLELPSKSTCTRLSHISPGLGDFEHISDFMEDTDTSFEWCISRVSTIRSGHSSGHAGQVHTPICCYINAKAVGSQTAIMSDDQYDETLGKLFDREFMKHVKAHRRYRHDRPVRGRGTTRTDVRDRRDSTDARNGPFCEVS